MVSAHGSPDSQAGMLLFTPCTKTSVHPPNRSDLLKCLSWTWDRAVLQHTWCLLLRSLAVPFKSTSSSSPSLSFMLYYSPSTFMDLQPFFLGHNSSILALHISLAEVSPLPQSPSFAAG